MDIMEIAQNPAWWNAARDRVKEAVEGPDLDIDRIIRAVLDNGGEIPRALRVEFPVLQDETVAAGVQNAVMNKSLTKPAKPW